MNIRGYKALTSSVIMCESYADILFSINNSMQFFLDPKKYYAHLMHALYCTPAYFPVKLFLCSQIKKNESHAIHVYTL